MPVLIDEMMTYGSKMRRLVDRGISRKRRWARPVNETNKGFKIIAVRLKI